MSLMKCPKCQAVLNPKPEHAGKVVKCGGCGTALKLPDTIPETPSPSPNALAQKNQESVATGETFAIKCPSCSVQLEVGPEDVGIEAPCPNCQVRFVVPSAADSFNEQAEVKTPDVEETLDQQSAKEEATDTDEFPVQGEEPIANQSNENELGVPESTPVDFPSGTIDSGFEGKAISRDESSPISDETQTLRIFISSPGDVAAERDKARQVITLLQKWYGAAVTLVPVLWEDLSLKIDATFQDAIDVVLSDDKGIDIAVFILWSRLGTPVTIEGRTYNSGTEREFDLMLHALEASGGVRPDVLFYRRDDDATFKRNLADEDDATILDLLSQSELAQSFIQEHFWDEKGENTRAYHSFHQPVEFASRFKTHLQNLIDNRLEDSGRARDATWTDTPYRGLEAFELEHADIFFGRDKEISDLENRLRAREREESSCAFVAVVGASGSGKSSLVRAGLRGNLTRFNFDELISEWRSIVMMPAEADGDPVTHLVQSLTKPGALPELTDGGVPLSELTETLIESPGATVTLTMRPLLISKKLLIVIDQFEELFTDKRISDSDRESFLLILEALAQSGVCWVVVTIRSDFYPIAQDSETFLRLKGETGHFDLLPPNQESLRRIISEPARMAGIRFEKRSPDLGGQSLIGKILEDAKGQPDTLPLLSDVLLTLYQLRDDSYEITFAKYDSLGGEGKTGLEGALSNRAEKEFTKLSEEERATFPEILHALVTVDGESDVRRRAELAALRDTPHKSTLVDAFIQARLLTADKQHVSLAHEALLRKWDRVADWVHENRQHLRIRTQVEEAHKRWLEGGQNNSRLLSKGLDLEEALSLASDEGGLVAGDEYAGFRDYIARSADYHSAREQRALRIRNTVISFLSLLTLLAVCGGVFGWWKAKEAVAEKKKADELRKNSDSLRITAEQNVVEARRFEGKFWLQKAREADYPAKQIYAAKAICFRANGADDPRNTGYGPKDPNHLFWDTLPIQRLDPLVDDREYREARDMLELPKRLTYPPRLLWSSPVKRHHVSTVECVAYSSDGRWIASGGSDAAIRLWNAENGDLFKTFKGHDKEVNEVVFSGNGEWLFSAGADGRIVRWDCGFFGGAGVEGYGKKKIVVSDISQEFCSIAVSPDGSRIASGSSDSTIRLWDVTSGEQVALLNGHTDSVFSVVFSPDGHMLASGSRDSTIRLWDVTSGEQIRLLKGHYNTVNSVAFSPDGQTLASGAWDDTIRLWDVVSGEEKAVYGAHYKNISSVVFSPDGQMLASGSGDTTIRLWDVTSGEQKALLGHTWSVQSVAFSPDSKTLVSGSIDNSIRLWSVTSGEEQAVLSGHNRNVSCVAFSPDGQMLASGSDDNSIRLWDVISGEHQALFSGHSYDVSCVAFSPDGKMLASGSEDESVRLWDVSSGEQKALLGEHSYDVSSVAFSPDGQILASGAWNIRLWDVTSGKQLALLRSGGVSCVVFSPDGQMLASSNGDTIQLWDVMSCEVKAILAGHSHRVNSVAFTPDGKTLASGSFDKTVRVWDVTSGEQLALLSGHSDSVQRVAFSPDGRTLVSGAKDHICFWDVTQDSYGGFPLLTEKSEPIALLSGHSDSDTSDIVQCVAFSPDGQLLATSGDKNLRLWGVTLGEHRARLSGHSNVVRSVAFSPDGKTLASGSHDDTIQFWDVASGKQLAPLSGHSDDVTSVAFSPDGQMLASGSEDESIRLWDVTSGEERAVLSGPNSEINSVAFSPDGQNLASVSWNILIWDIPSGEYKVLLDKGSSEINCVAFSPDGQILATGSFGRVRLWDATSGAQLAHLNGHTSSVWNVAFSPDGKMLASGAKDTTIRFWDVTSGEQLALLSGHTDSVLSVAFSPDSKTLVSGSKDNTIRLWDVASAEQLGLLRGHDSIVHSVTFSPDGRTLASGSWDDSIHLWNPVDVPVTDWLDVSVYQRHQWMQLDSTDSLQWLNMSGNLGFRVPRATPPPKSLFARLSMVESKLIPEQARIRATFHLDHHQWKPFWLNWKKMTEADRTTLADRAVAAFALLAADPPKGYPPGWFETKFLELRKGYSGSDPLSEPLKAGFFAKGVMSRSKSAEMVTIAKALLEKLPNHLRQKTEFEIVRTIYTSGSGDADLLAIADQTVPELSAEWKLKLEDALNRLASKYATSYEVSALNGSEAVRLATLVCEMTKWEDTKYLQTLAAAHAEAGDFDKAVEWQTNAIELAEEDDRELFKSRLKLFENGQPYRQE